MANQHGEDGVAQTHKQPSSAHALQELSPFLIADSGLFQGFTLNFVSGQALAVAFSPVVRSVFTVYADLVDIDSSLGNAVQ